MECESSPHVSCSAVAPTTDGLSGWQDGRRCTAAGDVRLKRASRMEGGDEKSMANRLNGVHESLPDNLEKSRLFNRTLHLHDPVGRVQLEKILR
jgi:hypothetical protein